MPSSYMLLAEASQPRVAGSSIASLISSLKHFEATISNGAKTYAGDNDNLVIISKA